MSESDFDYLPTPPDPFPYQLEDIRKLCQQPRQILNYEMGLGKTAVVVKVAEQLKLRRILYITKNKLKWNVAQEIEKWYPLAPITVVEGTEIEKLQQVKDFISGFLVVGYESLQRVTAAREERLIEREARIPLDLIPHLETINWHALFIDECHRLANRKAFHTLGVHRIIQACNPPVIVPMTGTLIANRVADLWPILRAVQPKQYTSFWNFVKKHANAHPGKYGWEMDDKPTDPALLKQEISSIVIRRTKQDRDVNYQAPPVTYEIIPVRLEDVAWDLYLSMERDSMAGWEDELLTATNLLAQITRLRQLAISPVLTGLSYAGPAAKIDTALELLDSFQSSDKVVVISQWVKVLELLAAPLSALNRKFVMLTGGGAVSDQEFQRRVQEFQSREGPEIALVSLDAGGEGLNLTAASHLIRLDLHWNPNRNAQGVARLDRTGQTQPITVWDIKAIGTIEDWLDSKLDYKEDIIKQIHGLVQQRREELKNE